MNKQQLHNFACYISEYLDQNIPASVIEIRYGIKTDKLNFREAVDAYVKHNKIKLEPHIKKQ